MISLLSLFLALLTPIADAKDIRITNDGGGFVNQYAYYYRGIRQRGDRVIIDGWCASSCTLALALPTTCVTSRAVLGFHAAYEGGWGPFPKALDPSLTQYFMSQYPPAVRQWLNKRGGLTSNLKYLKGIELAALVRKCK